MIKTFFLTFDRSSRFRWIVSILLLLFTPSSINIFFLILPVFFLFLPSYSFASQEQQFSKSKYVPPHEVGRPVTLQMLLDANILTPGKGNMSIEYMVSEIIFLHVCSTNLSDVCDIFLFFLGPKIYRRFAGRRQDQIA